MHSRNRKRPTSGILATTASLLLCVAATAAHAEYRVALLIDNSIHEDKDAATPKRDLDALAEALNRYGVRCVIKRNLEDERTIRETIDAFTDDTPTASTAIIYFSGLAVSGKHNGKDALVLVGADARKDRGQPLHKVLESLNERGGSRLNIVILDSPETPKLKHEPPDECLIAFNDAPTLIKNLSAGGEMLAAICEGGDFHESTITGPVKVTGRGSVAISPPDTFVFGKNAGDEWVDRRGAVFVWCPPGEFVMGSPLDEPGRFSDEQQRQVVIEEGFWISKYELTRSESLRGHSNRSIATHKNHPLTMMNHDDIKRMTTKTMTEAAQQHAGLPADWQYSLPTEAQWEYAARAGSTTAYCFGDDVSKLPDYANFADKTFYDTKSVFSLRAHRTLDDGVAKLARVGQYKPNAWGLYDVHGNVAEWCINGAIRGGSWTSTAATCRLAYRHHFTSRNEQNFIGYRVVIQKKRPADENHRDGGK